MEQKSLRNTGLDFRAAILTGEIASPEAASPYAIYTTWKVWSNKFTNKSLCFCNLFQVRGAWDTG